jgi:steroid delta-isomerase-like uncharacterized protein/uncharacterized protein (TIGR02246 family)
MSTNIMWPSMLKFVSNVTKAVIIIVTAGFSSMVAAQTVGDSASVYEFVEAYQRTINTHDPAALAAFFTEDADFVMFNLPAVKGRQAIENWWRDFWQSKFNKQEPERRGTFILNSVRLITADVAVANIETVTGGRNTQGQELIVRKARGTWVLIRQNGKWFISAMRGMPTERDRIIRASDKDQIEANKALIRRMNEEVWNKGNLKIMEELYSPDFAWHFLPTGYEIIGLDSLRKNVRNHRKAFPVWTEEIKHIVAEGDLVAIHFVSRGTNEGSFLGNPPTGKPIQINEMSIFRIVDGKITEQWLIPDLLSLNQQLGFIPQSN